MTKPSRVFTAERFQTTRDWIYFCLEFALEICRGCHLRARKRTEAGVWYCSSCQPALQPALVEALATRRNVTTACLLCHEPVALRDAWISEDCQRVYCASHLRPLRQEDRFRLAGRYVRARIRPDRRRAVEARLREHSRRVHCGTCAFNAQGIYDGDQLVEIDRGRRCDSAPDTLHCADLES